MDVELQRSLLQRLLELKRDGTTAMADTVRRQPASAYTDQGHLAREFEVLFREHPLVVGMSADPVECGESRRRSRFATIT